MTCIRVLAPMPARAAIVGTVSPGSTTYDVIGESGPLPTALRLGGVITDSWTPRSMNDRLLAPLAKASAIERCRRRGTKAATSKAKVSTHRWVANLGTPPFDPNRCDAEESGAGAVGRASDKTRAV